MSPLFSIASSAGPAVVDLAVVAGLVALAIGVLKPLVALRLDPNSTAYDSTLQILAILSAAGLICLAQYAPAIFAVTSSAVAVAAGAMGGYRVVKGVSPVLLASGTVTQIQSDPASVVAVEPVPAPTPPPAP